MKKPQLFIHFKEEDIPTDKKDSRYSAFWENEKNKCLNGVNIDGFQFSGWLYLHINHWKLGTDDPLADNTINADILTITPQLRDNEVIINKNLLRAEQERKGICVMGLRQMGKSSFLGSYGGRAGILFANSQNLIMGTNADDLANITQNIDFGLLNCSEYFRIPRISRDWGSERVLLGVKKKSGDNIVHSTYVIRNTVGGKRTEKGAGVSNLKCNLWDEIGKDDFLRSLTATKPAMLGANGWRCVPIATGTGGNVEKAKDAKELFFSPHTHKFLEFYQDDGRVTGLFMPGWLRQDCKYKTTLAQYLLDNEELKEIPEDSELWQTEMLVSDKEKAILKIKEELQDYLNDGNIVNYNAWRAYYPLDVDDIFLSENTNLFVNYLDSIKAHKSWLESNYKPEYVRFYRDQHNNVKWEYTYLKPITVFPVKQAQIRDACVCIYEHPEDNVPHGTYIVAIDPYNEDVSSDKINSLGCIYVYKRGFNPMGSFQNKIVASWAGRCSSVKDFHELCLMIAEYYNAIEGVFPENEDKTLIQYFFMKKKGHYFAQSVDLAREINPSSKTKRQVGLAATIPNQKHYMRLMVEDVDYEEDLVDDEANITTITGVSRILDPMLLEEMKNYRTRESGKGIHDGNFDRIVTYGHALTLARFYDVKYPNTTWKSTKTEEKKEKREVTHTPWGTYTKENDIFTTPTQRKSTSLNRMFR